MASPFPARALACLAAVLLLAAPAFSADSTVEKSYALPEHGSFKVSAPGAWKDELLQPQQPVPPTITFRPPKGNAFEIAVSPLWRPRPDVPLPTAETMRRQVEQGAENVKSQAAEKEIKVVEFQGKTGPGFYFSATDKAPKPEGYKYLTQGMMLVSELLVVFTVLSNERKDQVLRDVITMLKSASHEQP